MSDSNRQLVAIGLNHQSAPVEVRERLAMPKELIGAHLKTLIQNGHAEESVILSTCNRVEIYALVEKTEGGRGIRSYLTGEHDQASAIAKHLYHLEGEEAVRHLFRVASSLDSLVVGEPQILGQLKEAYDSALNHRSAGRVLGRVVRRAISVGKKVRTETAIGSSTVSVGTAGVDLAEQVLGNLEGRTGLIVGAGDLAELVAVSMKNHGLSEIIVVNRTLSRAEELAQKVGGVAVPYEALASQLDRVDVAVTSTASQRPILTPDILAPVMRRRRFRPLFLLDLSVPRNIAEEVNGLEGAYVFNIDDLQEVAKRGQQRRQEEALIAEALVRGEAERCYQSLDALNAGPLISAMTQRADEILSRERQRSHKMLSTLSEEQRLGVEAMNRAMVKRLLHDPIALARHLAEEGRSEEMELLGEAFGLQVAELLTEEAEVQSSPDES